MQIVHLSESAEKPSLLCDRIRSQNSFQNSEAIKPKGRVALPKRMKFQNNSKRPLALPYLITLLNLSVLGFSFVSFVFHDKAGKSASPPPHIRKIVLQFFSENLVFVCIAFRHRA